MYRTLLPVLLTVFLDLIGFGVVIPLLSFYAGEHGATRARPRRERAGRVREG